MDVVLVRRQGRFSGEAFVVLPGMMQVEFALNKHKAYMGKRYVEVQQSCREVCNANWLIYSEFSRSVPNVWRVGRIPRVITICYT